METGIQAFLKNRQSAELIAEIKRDDSLIHYADANGVSLLLLSYYYRLPDVSDYILSRRPPRDIYEAVVAGDANMVTAMLDQNPSLLNQHAADGFTPLGLAAYFGRVDVANVLLVRKADPNVAASNGFGVAPLHSAVAANQYDIVKLLLDAGANPNAVQQKDITPLHSAVHLGNAQIVSLLLAHGADKQAQTDNGKTPIDLAPAENVKELRKLLA
jgi:uncharacterized protein